jgi:methylated-DNA-protein-cysteine methyltransferase-like protein
MKGQASPKANHASRPGIMQEAMAAAIRRIPRGKVSTYGAVAKAAGYPRCARHVANLLKVVRGLPWQRVLGATGRIALPAEMGLEQRFLLQAEGVRFRGRRVDLAASEFVFAQPAGRRRNPAHIPKK